MGTIRVAKDVSRTLRVRHAPRRVWMTRQTESGALTCTQLFWPVLTPKKIFTFVIDYTPRSV